jgi:DNA-binding MarR family transcriptional regulator
MGPMTDLRRLLSDVGRVHAHLVAAANARLRNDLDLSVILVESMTVIADVEGCRTHDLAAGLGMTSGGASKLVDRLSAMGYCQRHPNPGDRRSSLLALTPAGRRRLAQAGQALNEELERLLGTVLSEAQITELAGTLRALRTPAVPPRGPPPGSR